MAGRPQPVCLHQRQAERIFGHPPAQIMAEPTLLWCMVHPDDTERLEREDRMSNECGEPFESEVRIVMPSGEMKWIQLSSMASPQEYQDRTLWSGVILDISERKQAEEEKNCLLADLRDALARIRKPRTIDRWPGRRPSCQGLSLLTRRRRPGHRRGPIWSKRGGL